MKTLKPAPLLLILLLALLTIQAHSRPASPEPGKALRPTEPEFRQFSTPEGLPNSMVHQVYQDRDGYIWISTFYGLFRYDGYEVRTYKSNLYTPGLLTSNNVLCVEEDHSHRLWIGTHEGLCILHKPTGQMRKVTLQGISKHRLNEIHVTRENKVYLGYIRGMARYDEPQDTLTLMTRRNCRGDVPEQVNIQCLLEDENGDLLIGTWQAGLYHYNVKENLFTHYPPLDPDNSVLSLFLDSRGTLWAGTNGAGLCRLAFSPDKKTLTVTGRYNHDPADPQSPASGHVYSIHEDLQTRSLWLGTRNGLSLMPLDDEGHFTNYLDSGSDHYLPVREVSSVLRDANGLMWIGTKGAGIFCADTRTRPFQVIHPRTDGKSFTDIISTLYVEENGAAYVGLGYGIDYLPPAASALPACHVPESQAPETAHTPERQTPKADNVTESQVPKTNSAPHKENTHAAPEKRTLLPSLRPYHISYSPSTHEVLLAVHDGGVIACRDGKVVRQYTTSNCRFLPHDLVYWVHEDRQGNWWLGTYKDISVRYRDGRQYQFCQLPAADPLLAKEITSIMEDNARSLWLTTGNHGILHVTGDLQQPDSLQCRNYCIGNGLLPANTPLCLLADKSGRVWAGTEGSGLCLYDPAADRFRSVHQKYNLPGDMVGSIEEDNNGNLWLGTNQGLARLTIAGSEAGRVRIFTVADGLADNFFNQNASFYRNGTFYFGCSRGIITFNAKVAEEHHSDISLRITDILIDGTPLEQLPEEKKAEITPFTADFTAQLTLPAAYSNFTIRFASLTYNRPQQNNYAYRLQGFDPAWHHTDATNRNAYYSKLPPGEYLFQLRATNENGDWGDVRTMTIVILPPFWATWWARLAYVLLSISLLALIWWEIRRRVLLRNRKHLQQGETDKVHHLKLQFLSSIPSDDEKFLQDAIACVHRHLGDADFDIPQFIDEMATSRTTLHKKLKSLTGQNTTGFVRGIRLKAACNILDANPGMRISDLAYQVGFNDPKYFSVCFKKEFGMQPTEYAMKAAKIRESDDEKSERS